MTRAQLLAQYIGLQMLEGNGKSSIAEAQHTINLTLEILHIANGMLEMYGALEPMLNQKQVVQDLVKELELWIGNKNKKSREKRR